MLWRYLAILIIASYTFAQNTTEEENLNDPDESYCLRFTWLGPEYDSTSSYNTTCALLLEEKRAVETPCRQPLVVTYDASEPDIQYIWQNHRTRVACRMARGQVCAKFSYSYNDQVQNVTYMCTKVSGLGEGAITSGCYSTLKNGYLVKVCVCESEKGLYLPCNGVSSLTVSTYLALAYGMSYILRNSI